MDFVHYIFSRFEIAHLAKCPSGELIIVDKTEILKEVHHGYREFHGQFKLPQSLIKSGRKWFHYCSWSTGELAIPDSITVIETSAFQGCIGISSLKLPNGFTAIGENSFYSCSGFKGTLAIPTIVQSLGDGAFKLTSFDLITFYGSEMEFEMKVFTN